MKYHRVYLVRRSSTSFQIRWYDATGRLRSEFAGPNKTTAEMNRRRKENEFNTPNFREIRETTPEEFMARLKELRTGKVSKATVAMEQNVLDECCSGLRYISQITTEHVERFLSRRLAEGLSAHTVNKFLRILRSAISRAVALGYIAGNPCASIKPIRAPLGMRTTLSPDDVRKLLKAQDPVWALKFRVLVETGMRISELLSLEFSDVDLDTGRVIIRAENTKSRKSRVVYLSRHACEMVRAHAASIPFSRLFNENRDTRTFERAAKACGVDCTAHVLRRTVISALAERNINQAVVQRLAGHASIATTTLFYTHVQDGTLRAAAEQLPWWNS
jgi:integrase